jgi:uncharacterized protein
MELQALRHKLLPEMAETCSFASLEGNYSLDAIQKGHRRFAINGGISYNLEFSNTGGAILLTGSASCNITGLCDRCLADANFSVKGDVQGYFLIPGSASSQRQQNEDGDGEFLDIEKDGSIDLAPCLYSAIVFELPQIVLCKSDCLGICAGCGADLNHESCSCEQSKQILL